MKANITIATWFDNEEDIKTLAKIGNMINLVCDNSWSYLESIVGRQLEWQQIIIGPKGYFGIRGRDNKMLIVLTLLSAKGLLSPFFVDIDTFVVDNFCEMFGNALCQSFRSWIIDVLVSEYSI